MAKPEENIAKDPFTEEAAHLQSAWPAYLGIHGAVWSREQYLEIVAKVAAEREVAAAKKEKK